MNQQREDDKSIKLNREPGVLSDRIDNRIKWYDRTKTALIVFGIVNVLLLTVFSVLTLRFTADSVNKLDINTRRLVDCTTPTGTCYLDVNKAQSGAVRNINQIVVLANYCTRVAGNNTLPLVEACVNKELAKAKK